MTAHEKAVKALNARLEQLQASLREAKLESSQQFLLQAVFATLAMADALQDYARGVGAFAQRRHAELKRESEALAAQHGELLKMGQELLEKLKAAPTDKPLRKEIERVQTKMEAVQKNVRRGANSLQRDVAPALGMIDQMSESMRRLSEAERADELKRPLKTIVEQVRELYAAQPGLPAKGLIDASAWETAALAELGQAAGFTEAYARAGHQATVALELMAMAVSETPPQDAAEATQRAHAAVATRLKEIAARFGGE